jgi:hypothetical protein
MELTDILMLVALFLVAGIVLYRTIRKKKWCPAVFGNSSTTNEKSQASDSGS